MGQRAEPSAASLQRLSGAAASSKKSTSPVSNEYSAPTTTSPSHRINCSRSSDPCRSWLAEILVGAVEPTAESLGMTEVFIGVIVVAIVGNAAEHSTAILMSVKDRMDLALGIAIGSATQIALFAAPLLVLLSYAIGPEPMDLVFTTAEVVAVAVSVLIVGQVAEDGESNWLEGVQLLAVYLILAVMFYFLPEASLAVE